MSQWEKLLEKIYSSSAQVRYKDLQKVLESFGYILQKSQGSHRVFRKEGADNIVIPVHNKKVKPVYVAQVKRAVEKNQEQEDCKEKEKPCKEK